MIVGFIAYVCSIALATSLYHAMCIIDNEVEGVAECMEGVVEEGDEVSAEGT